METKFRKLLDEMSKEYVPLKYKAPSLDWQLGNMVGEYIIATQLPTLSTDMLKTSTIIEIGEALTELWEERQRLKFDTEESNKVFYENLAWYKLNIEQQHLPKEIKTLVPRVDPQNIEEFQEGIKSALWECDLSHYRFREMQPNNEWNVRTVIILSYEG